MHFSVIIQLRKKGSIDCVQENEITTIYRRRLYLLLRIGKISSVSWDLYIVKNLLKGDIEEKHSEDERWADYLGKYFLSD